MTKINNFDSKYSNNYFSVGNKYLPSNKNMKESFGGKTIKINLEHSDEECSDKSINSNRSDYKVQLMARSMRHTGLKNEDKRRSVCGRKDIDNFNGKSERMLSTPKQTKPINGLSKQLAEGRSVYYMTCNKAEVNQDTLMENSISSHYKTESRPKLTNMQSVYTARSTMTRSIERKKSISRGANAVDVKCINCGDLISEDKVQHHSKTCGTVKSKIQLKSRLSSLRVIKEELNSIKKALEKSLNNSNNEEEHHYFIKIKEIIDEMLSISDYDTKSIDLLKFINKDIQFLYETCEGTANVMLYIERIAELAEAQMGEIKECNISNKSIDFNASATNSHLKSSLKKTCRIGSKQVDLNSEDSERQTILNTKKNELTSIKRNTLKVMNKLLKVTLKNAEFEDQLSPEHEELINMVQNILPIIKQKKITEKAVSLAYSENEDNENSKDNVSDQFLEL